MDNLNKMIKGTAGEKMSLEEINRNISTFSIGVRNNAGGHYNHQLFWTVLTPQKILNPLQNYIRRLKSLSEVWRTLGWS